MHGEDNLNVFFLVVYMNFRIIARLVHLFKKLEIIVLAMHHYGCDT